MRVEILEKPLYFLLWRGKIGVFTGIILKVVFFELNKQNTLRTVDIVPFRVRLIKLVPIKGLIGGVVVFLAEIVPIIVVICKRILFLLLEHLFFLIN